MDLLSMLTGSMTSDSSVSALSKKTGASSGLTSALVSAALPMLLNALTNNASSSQSGAESLIGALGQHTSTAPMAQQLESADEEDGEKIIEHILGGNASSVISALSGQTGASSTQVQSLLNNMAPAMMSGVSAATTSASQATEESPADLGSLLGMFGGTGAPAASSVSSSLFGSLLGGDNTQADESAFNGSSLMSLLGGLMK